MTITSHLPLPQSSEVEPCRLLSNVACHQRIIIDVVAQWCASSLAPQRAAALHADHSDLLLLREPDFHPKR
jgi:hypothetical protein